LNFQRIIELFAQKIVTKLSKIWGWDLRSGIRKKPVPDPGLKKPPDPGSGSATLLCTVCCRPKTLFGYEYFEKSACDSVHTFFLEFSK
jgi:hypothetical protein